MKLKKIFAASLLLITNVATAQTTNEFANENIKTVEFRKTSTEMGMPVCTLGESLTLSFDVMDDPYHRLAYSIRHCNAAFEPDELDFYEFAEGFDSRSINNYRNSFNTHSVFTHYILDIPNEDVRLKISGNYLITIFDESNPDEVILQKKFMIAEPETRLKVDAQIERPFLAEYSITGQQVKVNVDNSRERISNAAGFLKVYVMQNGDVDHRHKLEYNFTDANNLRFHHNEGENIFDGGSEYLYFDAKDVNFKALGIDKIEFRNGMYHYSLTPHYPTDVSYSFQEDLNGQYYIKNDRGFDRDVESDYIEVDFRLKYPQLPDGDVYVFGALSNYSFGDSSNKMSYDSRERLYRCSMLLKQGLYNYTYIIKHTDGTLEYPDGSWYNTENNYLITVYNTDYTLQGDRLVWMGWVNTMK